MAILKRSISLLLAFVMVLALLPAGFVPAVSAIDEPVIVDGGDCGAAGYDVTWVLYDDGELKILGTGPMADFGTDSNLPPWSDYNGQITRVTILGGVTAVGNYSFYGMDALRVAEIDGSVQKIGVEAFSGCGTLKTLYLNDGLLSIRQGAFQNCGLTSVTIPATATTVEQQAFKGCDSLSEAHFSGDAPSSFGDDVFAGCASDFTVYYPVGASGWTTPEWNGYPAYVEGSAKPKEDGDCGGDVTWTLYDDGTLVISGTGAMEDYVSDSTNSYTSSSPFYGMRAQIKSVVVEDGVTHVGNYAFYLCSEITSVKTAGSVKSIGSSAFGGSKWEDPMKLSKVTLSEGLETIGSNAFTDCYELTSVTIPDSVTSIDYGAFYQCHSLIEVKFGKGLKEIGGLAFMYCESLQEIVIPDSVTTLGYWAFSYCTGVTKLIIGKGVTNMEEEVFSNMSSLSSVTIPGNIKTLPSHTFYNCRRLSEVTFEEGLETIGYSAFYYCSSLESVQLPASIKRLENWAFAGCSNLSYVYFQSSAPSVDPEYLFYNCDSDFKIYYPSHLQDQGWSTPTWNGYPAYPYDVKGTLPETWPVNNGAHVITVVTAPEKDGDPVSPIVGARIEIADSSGNLLTDENAVTDDSGQFAFYGTGGQQLRIYAEGYQLRRMIYPMKSGESRLILLDKLPADGAPYFSMLTALADIGGEKTGYHAYRDLRSEEVRYTEGKGRTLVPFFEIVSSEDIYIDSVELVQDGKNEEVPRYIDISANDYIVYDADRPFASVSADAVRPGAFHSDRRIYAVINYRRRSENLAEFYTVKVPLTLFVDPVPAANPPTESNGIDLSQDTVSGGSVSWLYSMFVDTDLGLLTNFLPADPSLESDLLNFSYEVETQENGNKKLEVALGFAKAESEGKDIFTGNYETGGLFYDLKDFIQSDNRTKGTTLKFHEAKVNKKLKDAFGTTRFRSFTSFEGELLGFFEAEFTPDGTLIEDTQAGKVLVSLSGKGVTGKTVILWGCPFYIEFAAEVGAETTLTPKIYQLGANDPPVISLEAEEIELTIPKLSVEGGVGIRGVATVGVGGVFENVVTITLDGLNSASKLVGSTNLYFRFYVAFLVDYREDFGLSGHAKDILYTITVPEESAGGNAHTYAAGQTISQQALAEPELQLSSRDYLTKASRWNGNPIRLLNNGGMATLQNGVLPNAMPELIDLGEKQILLFLADDGTRSLGSHTRLMYSVRENGTWSDPAPVWDTATGDQYFDCCLVNGELYVAWQKLSGAVTGEDVDSMLTSLASQSEIALARWDSSSGTFTEQQYLTENDTLDMMVSLCDNLGTLQVTWVTNSENDLMGTSGENTVLTQSLRDGMTEEVYTTDRFLTELVTAADRQGLHVLIGALDEENNTDLLHITGGAAYTVMENGTFAGLSAESGCFLWQDSGILYRYSPEIRAYEAMVSLEEGTVSSSYRYIKDGETEAILWTEGQEPARIMASIYAQGEWQEPIVLADNIDKSVNFMDGALMDDGSILLVANTADYSTGDDSVTALQTALIEPMADVAVTYVRMDDPDPVTGTQPITVQVANTGTVTVDELMLTVSGGYALLDTVCAVELAPGGECTLTGTLDVSGITGLTTVDVQAQASSDAHPADNHMEAHVGYTDAALSMDVQELGDQVYILLTASNGASIPTDARIRVYQNGLDTEELAVLELGTLVYGENIQSLYTLDKTAVDFGGGDSTYFLFSLETDQADASDGDGLQVCTIRAPQEQPDFDGSDREEIITVQPESIEILTGDVTFAGPDAEPVKLEVLVLPEDSSFTHPAWTVENSDVATVLADGTLYPVAPGTTTVTATLGEELFDTVTVTVKEGAEDHEHTPALILGYDATCTDPGLSDGACCAECGETLTEQTATDPLGHDHIWYVIEDAGCDTPGLSRGECTRCGDALEQTLEPVGHDWDGGSCRRCGEGRKNPFTDVPEGSFYYDPVLWAVENGITNGTTPTTFGPNDPCMRAHVVTFLWRAAGSPEPGSDNNPFVDVKPTDFYYKAVLWAVENGITNGIDATHFGPTSYCNRAQVVTFLHRALGNPEPASQDNPFTDVPAGSFYYKPVLWAVENGVTNGMSETAFGPNSICNRAQIVTFLYRAFT